MTLWLALALMTVAAVFAVLWPLARRGGEAEEASGDVAVYRDQLDELERDKQAGLIAAGEAAAARVEIARRLLGADAAERAAQRSLAGADFRRRAVTVLAIVLVPLGAAGVYLKLGAPTLPGAPLAQRQADAPEKQSLAALVAQVEKHLESNPEDGRGWEVLAPVYARLGRAADAVRARQNALRLLGSTAARQADYGEALTVAANGVVTAEARAAFDAALAADANEVKARYFLGLAAEQDGRTEQAAATWRKLLAEAPADAPWREFVRQALARVDKTAAETEPAPSGDDVAAAALLTPEQRAEMVRGMVERLAARLRGDGSDLEGWERLLRSYKALGDAEKAKAAAAEARKALAADDEKLRQINALIRQLGLES